MDWKDKTELFRLTENYADWRKLMPRLSFPADWKVTIIPPFSGAAARFLVDKGKDHVSVYADFADMLGCFGEPYWEICPYEGETFRTEIANGEELIEAIGKSLKDQEDRA